MRTLKQQNLIHDTNYALFPDGAIQNEIQGSQEGTPVVREVYNDLLMNIYAYIRNRGFIPNNIEDNQNNGYQIIEALKRNINVLNDSEKILSINGSTWNINIDFSLIPDKYFVFARAAEDYSSSIVLIKGTGPTNYSFASTNFKTGDELLIIIDQALVRTYNISSISSESKSISFPVFGTPLSFLESANKIWYEKEGILYSDVPESYYLKNRLQTFFGEDVEIRSIVNVDAKILCCVFLQQTVSLKVVYFNIGDMDNVLELTSTNLPLTGFNGASDLNVLMFAEDNNTVYFTNNGNNSINNEQIACYKINFSTNILDYQSTFNISNEYVKTTNCLIINSYLVTLYDESLKMFSFTGSTPETKPLPTFAGNIFKVGNQIYFTNSYNAIKWKL